MDGELGVSPTGVALFSTGHIVTLNTASGAGRKKKKSGPNLSLFSQYVSYCAQIKELSG